MMESLLFAKIAVSILAVVVLSLVAEHVSPRIAGILGGYPLGTAIALFFIGVENGDTFAATSAIHTLAGFTAALVLVWAYWRTSCAVGSAPVLACATVSVLLFLAVAWTLNVLNVGLWSGGLLSVVAILGFRQRFRRIPDVKVDQKVAMSWQVMAFRAVTAAVIVVAITGIAAWIGPQWSGLLSAFPITLFPFLLIIHLSYGVAPVRTIIKHYPMGLGALLFYTLTVIWSYPLFGTVLGTAMAFAVATVYLVLLALLTAPRKKKLQC